MLGSLHETLEHFEELSRDMPLVIVVRDADRLLADVGLALIHFIAGWEVSLITPRVSAQRT